MFIETSQLSVKEPRKGWRGRFFHSLNMTFAYYTVEPGAIVPAIVVHVLADVVTLPFEWGLLGPLPVGRFQTRGIDTLFVATVVLIAVGSVATVAAFLRLYKIVQVKS